MLLAQPWTQKEQNKCRSPPPSWLQEGWSIGPGTLLVPDGEGVFFHLQGENLGEGGTHSGLQRGFSALWGSTCSTRADPSWLWFSYEAGSGLRCEGRRRKLGLVV